ncbi:hypothetical protein [Marinobacter xestospongiae]|uniref:Uncharacterized protein n=1 Tax=Marinobacter xestospongiae TaxID=994319 RepID=A0ABU3VY66_9GAMM|nr:hypothetical protein [Marinobacter xestospongiae]MDV2079225.1 hypothetical protein [Marinobacter xestospongiae]
MNKLSQSLFNEDIPNWRKLGVFILQVATILFGVIHFVVYFQPGDGSRELYGYFSAMVAITAVVQLIAGWFAYRRRVPGYLWLACAVWIILTVFWQGLVVVLLSVS